MFLFKIFDWSLERLRNFSIFDFGLFKFAMFFIGVLFAIFTADFWKGKTKLAAALAGGFSLALLLRLLFGTTYYEIDADPEMYFDGEIDMEM